MSILIYIDHNDNNMLELIEGHYLYNNLENSLTDVKHGYNIYITDRQLHVFDNWLDNFVINPMTKISIYNINQLNETTKYSGDVMIVYNYNTKKSQRKKISTTSFISDPIYIVVEKLTEQDCKNGYKNTSNHGGILIQQINSENHRYKQVMEPVIPYSDSDHNNMLIIIVLVIILFGVLFMISYNQNNHNNTNNLNIITSTYSL